MALRKTNETVGDKTNTIGNGIASERTGEIAIVMKIAMVTTIATMIVTGVVGITAMVEGAMAVTANSARVVMATTVTITSTRKQYSKAIRMDCTPARAMLSVVRVTTRNDLTTTATQISGTTLRTAIGASFNKLIAKDFCKAISRDFSSMEDTTVTETTVVAGRGNS